MTKLKESAIRNKQILVRLNQYEYGKLEEFAAKNYVSVSEALRMLIRSSS